MSETMTEATTEATTTEATTTEATPALERWYSIRDFATESGSTLPEATIVYATHGVLNDARDNAVLVPSHYMSVLQDADWIVGEGKALDPAEYFIVTTELFGNGRSSSPSNTPAPFDGPRFPVTTIRDNVEIVHRLLTEELGIAHLRAVVGFSMGAMQSTQWAVSHPGFMDKVVASSGNAKSYPHGNTRLEGQIAAIITDPAFASGEYSDPPTAGVSAFGVGWAAWLYSQQWWRDELWLELDAEATWESTVERFRSAFIPGADANNLILQCRTWQQHDVGTTPGFHGDTSAALGSITADVLYLPSATDLYFPVGDARLEVSAVPSVTLAPIPSLWGHTAGAATSAADADFVNGAVRRFLADEPIAEAEYVSRAAAKRAAVALAEDSLAGDYLGALSALFSEVARLAVPRMSSETKEDVTARFDATLSAIAERSIPGLHEHGWALIFTIVESCPNRVLVDAAKPGIASSIARFTALDIAQVADWDLLTERYTDMKAAMLSGEGGRAVESIRALYQVPSNDAW
jgi:homoserine O-acetyltransferase